MTRHIYISGPMRKMPEFNFPAFLAAADALREADPEAVLFSPAQKDIDNGFDPTGLTGHEDLKYDLGFDLREALAMDCAWICTHATHLYMLRGWSKSSGARAEMALAEALGLNIFYQPQAERESHPEYGQGWNDAFDYIRGLDFPAMHSSHRVEVPEAQNPESAHRG